MSIILAVLSALFYGAGDFSGGLASRRNSVAAVLVISQAIGMAGILIAAPLAGSSSPVLVDFLWGGLAGLGGAIGLGLLYAGIARTSTAVVSPTAALSGTALPVVFGLLLGEQAGPLGWTGMALAVPAILLLTAEPGESGEITATDRRERAVLARKALILGLGAGIGFGFFFIAISRTSEHSGLWPLVSARVVSISAVAVTGLFMRSRFRPAREFFWAIPAAGLLDMAANVTFLFAVKGGLLVLVAVITSLYPAPTVLLSRLVFREKLAPHRIAGLVLAVTGVALMSI